MSNREINVRRVHGQPEIRPGRSDVEKFISAAKRYCGKVMVENVMI